MKLLRRPFSAVTAVAAVLAVLAWNPSAASTRTSHAAPPERAAVVDPAKLAPFKESHDGGVVPQLIPNVFPDPAGLPRGDEPPLKNPGGGALTSVAAGGDGGSVSPFAFPAVDTRFDGPIDNGVAPPDCVLAVGRTHVVSLVNVRIATYSRTGALLQGPFSLASFFGIPPEFGVFDPLAIYDPFSDRFIVAVLADYGAAQDSRIYVAFSQTGDATGLWNTYWIDADRDQAGRWADYGSIGIDRLAVYFTANMFTRGGGYSNVTLFIYSKDDGYAGQPLRNTHMINVLTEGGGSPYRLRPSTVPVTVPGDPYYLAHTDSGVGDRINLWRLTGERFASPTLVASTVPLPGMFYAPPKARQPATSKRVDTLGANLWNVVYQGGKLWTAQSISGAQGAAAWVSRIDVSTIPASREQTYSLEVSGKDTYFPHVIPDTEDNDFALLSAHSGPDLYPTGRYWNVDSAGTVRAAELVANPTTFNLSGRHGDYFAVQADPIDRNRLWMIAQYQKDSTFSGNAGIASVRFEDVPPPSDPPPVPDGKNVAGTMLTVSKSGANDVTLSWDATTCPPVGSHLVWYDLASMSSYTVTAETCASGTSGTWTGTPPAGNVAVVVVADDAATTEGSHGRDSAGQERPSHSVSCGFTTKSTAGTCGP